MKKLCVIFMLAALLSGCNGVSDAPGHWATIAEYSSRSLITNFWNSENGYFNHLTESDYWGHHYWPQAHGLDVLVDAYLRSGDAFYRDLFMPWLTGVHRANGNQWTNNYIDDMQWIGLAALRGYQATGIPEFLTAVRDVWDGTDDNMDSHHATFGIKRAWVDDEVGGIFWESRRHRHSRNACSNAPAAILAAHLYQAFGDPEDLYWAKKIYHWQRNLLFNPETGAVYDNIDTNTGEINRRWIFTYNTGTHLGAALELYNITGDRAYIYDAMKAADFTITTLINTDDNILRSEGRGDGGLFKGIFIRNFTQLIMSDALPEEVRERYITFLTRNAEALWNYGTTKPYILFGPYWKTSPGDHTGLTEHLSGVMLMEAMALLEREGFL